jgi:8-oxo-dGTP pyrophosphatase MutT (NUDIX family)
MADQAPILRPAARVLLIDEQQRVLLLRAKVGADDVWMTPGGALEPGETAEQAALRELREETGIESAELSPCVWTRTHRFEWGGQRYEQQERFFVARTEAPAITLDGCGEVELVSRMPSSRLGRSPRYCPRSWPASILMIRLPWTMVANHSVLALLVLFATRLPVHP